jgi:hypothetical protein
VGVTVGINVSVGKTDVGAGGINEGVEVSSGMEAGAPHPINNETIKTKPKSDWKVLFRFIFPSCLRQISVSFVTNDLKSGIVLHSYLRLLHFFFYFETKILCDNITVYVFALSSKSAFQKWKALNSALN